MDYLVKITTRAERDFAHLHDYIEAGHSEVALKWYNGLRKAILGLEKFPKRWPVTPENRKFRHLLYGHKPYVYRMIYRILLKRKEVEILHIRHGARQRFKSEELQ